MNKSVNKLNKYRKLVLVAISVLLVVFSAVLSTTVALATTDKTATTKLALNYTANGVVCDVVTSYAWVGDGGKTIIGNTSFKASSSADPVKYELTNDMLGGGFRVDRQYIVIEYVLTNNGQSPINCELEFSDSFIKKNINITYALANTEQNLNDYSITAPNLASNVLSNVSGYNKLCIYVKFAVSNPNRLAKLEGDINLNLSLYS